MKKANSRKELLAHLASLRRFNAWEAEHSVPIKRDKVISMIGAIYELLPPASRRRAVNTEGLQELHRALSYLRARQ
jgi:hypothetical protein